jgi:ribosomal protein S18 acetylase RimI-like enzyme
LADDAGTLVGFAQLGWGSRTPSVTALRPVELQRLYVTRPAHGTGVAHELMNEVLRLAREHAADHLWLGVWEHNPRAIAFYRKYGFREVGEHVFLLGRDPQRDLILVRSVSGDPDVAA